jgi:hypothetical protein
VMVFLSLFQDERWIGDDVEKDSCVFTWIVWGNLWKPPSRQLVSGMKIKSLASCIWSRNANHVIICDIQCNVWMILYRDILCCVGKSVRAEHATWV